jgi:hypothetical protein
MKAGNNPEAFIQNVTLMLLVLADGSKLSLKMILNRKQRLKSNIPENSLSDANLKAG